MSYDKFDIEDFIVKNYSHEFGNIKINYKEEEYSKHFFIPTEK